MILLADSGSTKTEWILLKNGEEVLRTETIGLNPFFVDHATIQLAIGDSELAFYLNKVKEVHFYGAGCSNKEKVKSLADSFKIIFNQAKIDIRTDIEGAVLAVADDEPCVVCILGTGSTFRIFDGKQIERKYSSLSYIIGDEGSGTHIAKALLRQVFYQKLPKSLEEDFFRDYPITSTDLMQKVYNEPQANRYLASFVPFCKKHIDIPIIEQIVLDSLEEFSSAHLMALDEIPESPVHFIGSIAYHFRPQLQKVADKQGFTLGKIVQKPLSNIKKLFTDS